MTWPGWVLWGLVLAFAGIQSASLRTVIGRQDEQAEDLRMLEAHLARTAENVLILAHLEAGSSPLRIAQGGTGYIYAVLADPSCQGQHREPEGPQVVRGLTPQAQWVVTGTSPVRTDTAAVRVVRTGAGTMERVGQAPAR